VHIKAALVLGPTDPPGSGITPLKYARNNAVALGRVLRDVCRSHRVILLAGDSTAGRAERKAIIECLEELAASDEPIKHFVFAFSGHGLKPVLAPAGRR